MSVSAIGASGTAAMAAMQKQTSSDAIQPAVHERENDGDKDDGTTAIKSPSPSVNLNGQKVGNTINVTA